MHQVLFTIEMLKAVSFECNLSEFLCIKKALDIVSLYIQIELCVLKHAAFVFWWKIKACVSDSHAKKNETTVTLFA